MAFGKWINNLKGLFEEGPMKELTEHVADQQKQEQEVKHGFLHRDCRW